MKKLFALLAAGLLAVMSGCGGQTASNAHFFDFIRVFNDD